MQHTIVDAEDASSQEKVVETLPEPSQERSNTDDSVPKATSSIQQNSASIIEDAVVDHKLSIVSPASTKSVQPTKAVLHDNMPAVTDGETSTSSDGINKPQSQPVQESADAMSSDFTQTSINAALGDKDAQVALGDMYKDGLGVQQDYKQLWNGIFGRLNKETLLDYSTALNWYLKSADQGNAQAYCNIGHFYRNGDGVSQDFSRAMEFFLTASDLGNADAQYNIGTLHYSGQGVPQDYSQALEWYRKAADQGDADAQCCIGYLYRDGEGVPQDYSQALYWCRKAAEQGDSEAQCFVGLLFGNGHGVLVDYSQASAWFLKAAKQGHKEAQYTVGSMYEYGDGVPQDVTTAKGWYLEAAKQGHREAQTRFNYLRRYGAYFYQK